MTNKQPKHPRYQDYVIKDGKLVGEFEQMYQDHEDPWQQAQLAATESEKSVGLSLVNRLNMFCGVSKLLELGCGYGHFTQRFSELGLDVTGVDISETAIRKARELHPACNFEVGKISDHEVIKALAPDVIVMSEITWYVLDDLAEFLAFLKREMPQVYLLHILTTYSQDEQRYGKEYFGNLDEIMAYFDMHYLESGQVHHRAGVKPVWFLGSYEENQLSCWPD